MNVVLDASAGIALAAGGEPRKLRAHLADARWVGAPSLYDFEVTNTIWKYQCAGAWDADQGEQVLERALGLVDERTPGEALAAEALALARRHGTPAYDMFYLALARRHDALLVTLDRGLAALARREGVRL